MPSLILSSEIRKVYRAICDDGTVHPSVSKLESEEARNKEAIGQRIRNMDLVFEQYTVNTVLKSLWRSFLT